MMKYTYKYRTSQSNLVMSTYDTASLKLSNCKELKCVNKYDNRQLSSAKQRKIKKH